MLAVIGILLASAVPVAATAWFAIQASRASELFFDALVTAQGSLPRQQVPAWLGGHTVSSLDYRPGMAALGRDSGDPGLEPIRRAAGTWNLRFRCQLPAGLLEAGVLAVVLSVNPIVPMSVAFLAWGVLQYLPFRYVLWASRPEVRNDWSLSMRAYALVGVVVVVTLVAAFGLVGLLLVIHG